MAMKSNKNKYVNEECNKSSVEQIEEINQLKEKMVLFDKSYQSTISSAVKNITNLQSSIELCIPNWNYLLNQQKSILKTQEQLTHLVKSSNVLNVIEFNNYDALFAQYRVVSDQASRIAKLSEAIKPQIKILTNALLANQYITQYNELILERWNAFEKEYNILKSEAYEYLKEYYWFITPNMDMSIIYDVVLIGRSDDENKLLKINQLFSDYFLKKDCNNLKEFVENWSEIPIFEERMSIFKDCVSLIRNCPKDINFSNLIVPALIPQIEGIQNDFLKSQGIIIDYGKLHYLDGEPILKENKKVYKKEYFRDLNVAEDIHYILNNVFLKVLFQKTEHDKPCETSLPFSRNKILHGEDTNYGREDYVWRCFMLLDIFSELYSIGLHQTLWEI